MPTGTVSINKAGKVRASTPKVAAQPKRRKLTGRASRKRMYDERKARDYFPKRGKISFNSNSLRKEKLGGANPLKNSE